MTTLEALQAMLDASGTTPYAAARAIGRGSSYVSGMLWRGSVPSADMLARIAAACGYEMLLVPKDKTLDTLRIDGGG